MNKFLITGGAGFIGSNIAETLMKKGHFVRVLDNFFSGKEPNLEFAKGLGKDKFQLLRGDIRDKAVAEKACEGIDAVLHQAALKSVPQSLKEPADYNDVNIGGLLTMLQAAQKKNVKRFVFASSSAVYGDSTEMPQRETQYPCAMSPYAVTKLTGEYYLRVFSQNFGLETVALRYFNVFGPKQAKDDEYAVVIPKFIACLQADKPTPIFGDGGQSRDFVYIDNVVAANILAATVLGIKHEVLNIAMGQSYTVLQLSQALGKILSKNIPPQFLPLRAGDIYRSESDITKATKVLGYRPLVSFEQGLQRTIESF